MKGGVLFSPRELREKRNNENIIRTTEIERIYRVIRDL